MGEIADWMIEQAMDIDNEWLDSKPKKVLKCKTCKSKDVYWHKTKKGWRLYTDKKPHQCFSITGAK